MDKYLYVEIIYYISWNPILKSTLLVLKREKSWEVFVILSQTLKQIFVVIKGVFGLTMRLSHFVVKGPTHVSIINPPLSNLVICLIYLVYF